MLVLLMIAFVILATCSFLVIREAEKEHAKTIVKMVKEGKHAEAKVLPLPKSLKVGYGLAVVALITIPTTAVIILLGAR